MNMLPSIPLDGEIIGPNDRVRFFLFAHTLSNERRCYEVQPGLSVREAIAEVYSKEENKYLPKNPAFFLQDGTRIPKEMWDRVRLKGGSTVVSRPVAEGFLVPMIAAVAAAASAASAFFAGLGIFGHILLAGLTMIAKYALNKLFGPKPPPKPDVSDAKAVYSINSSRNEIAQWSPIPLLLGRHRITPPLAAPPYTETVGDDQYLRQLFCNGYGPLYLEEATAKIGETAVSSYAEAQIEHRYGYYVGEPDSTLYPSSVIDEPLSIELLSTDVGQVKSTASDAITIAVDFMWPSGLTYVNDKGKREYKAVVIYVYYRLVGGNGVWLSAPTVNFSAKTMKAIRRTITWNVAKGQYEVMVKKVTPEPDLEDLERHKWSGVDNVGWTAIRSFRTGRPVTFQDAPISLTAMRIRASGRINQTVDTYNIIAWSRVTAFNGSYWVANQPSRNPADLYRWVLQCGANRRPYADSKIDLISLQNWWYYCVNKGWFYDKIVMDQTSVYDLLIEICAAGRAMPVFKDGKWSVVWDEANPPVTQLFTPRNSWNFEEQRDLDPIPHGYRIRFPNEVNGWREDERIVYNDGYSKANATLLEGFAVAGTTHTDRIWKHGRFHLAQRILRPGVYSLNASWDALMLIRGDRVRVNYDTFKLGLYAGRVEAVDTVKQEVTLDTEILLTGGSTYMFRFRLKNGTWLERTVDPGYVGYFTRLGLVGDALPMPAAGDLWSFGIGQSDSKVLRVTGIEPGDDLLHRLMMVDDAPEIAYADIGQIPDYNSGITEPLDPYTLPPRNLQLSDGVYDEGGNQYWANIVVTWDGPPYGKVVGYQIQYREESDAKDVWTSAAQVTSLVKTFDIRKLESGVYTVRVRCLFDNNSISQWATSASKATTEFNTPPPDVENFRIATMGDISILRWDPVSGVGITYEIRWASLGVTEPTWNSAIPLITSATNTVQIGTRSGTFFIKAVKPWGLSSANAKLLYTEITTLTQLNFVDQIIENDDYLGVHDRTEIADYELRLKADATYTSFESQGIYYFHEDIDLGELIDSRVSILIDAYGFNPQTSMDKWITLASVDPLDTIDNSEWSVRPEYRATTVDPTLNQWGDWQLLNLSDILAWGIQFRLVMEGRAHIDDSTGAMRAVATPSVQQLSVTIDMADRIEKGDDVSAPTAGIVVTFPNGKYRTVPAVVITPQNMVQGDYYKVDQKTETSFRVRFWTSANALKPMVFDWMSKGWGRVR
jgi:hypothetical protein